MKFASNKKNKYLLAATANIMRKRCWRKAIKSKHQYRVEDIFIDKTDSQYNKILQKL